VFDCATQKFENTLKRWPMSFGLQAKGSDFANRGPFKLALGVCTGANDLWIVDGFELSWIKDENTG
jgi:hypothetical protein